MRSLSTPFRNSLEASANGDAALLFATISHPSLTGPIRVVNDIVDYVWGGETFYGLPFMMEFLSDGDRPPSGKLTIQNIDRRIGQAIIKLDVSPGIQIDVLPSSDFGAAVAGVRTEIGTPTAEYSAPRLRLRNVTGDAMAIEGELWSYDLSREPYPAVRSTKDRLPGLFR